MHKEEIFSLIKLIEKTKIQQIKEINFTEDYLPIIFFIMTSYYENKSCTVSNLSLANSIPFNTAKRKINNLLNSKLIYKNTRLRDGKHHIFLPTPSLINIFKNYLNNLKNHIGNNFGLNNTDNEINNWYYGGKYFKSKIIPNPKKTNLKNNKLKKINFLIWQSSAFNFLKNYEKPLGEITNLKINFVAKKWDALKHEIISNSTKEFSKFLSKQRDLGVRQQIFIIGGAFGLCPSLEKDSNGILSLGKMVWPHFLARVLVVEQIYRAASLITGGGYHKE